MTPHRRNRATSLLLALLLALAGPAAGQLLPDTGAEPADTTGERWWQVELVIFRYTDGAALQEEAWPDDWAGPPSVDIPSLNMLLYPAPEPLAMEPAPETASSQLPPPAPTMADRSASATGTYILPSPADADWFLPTPEGEWRLGAQVSQLRRSGRVGVLLHQSWRHRLRTDTSALVYRIVAGRELTGQGPDVADNGWLPPPATVPNTRTSSRPLNNAATVPDGAGPPGELTPSGPQRHYQLEGTLAFDLRRFLHLTTNLWLAIETPAGSAGQPAGSVTSNEPAVRYVHHQEARRVRSGEIHYLDNPLLGVIVLIAPWQKPADVSGADAGVSGRGETSASPSPPPAN